MKSGLISVVIPTYNRSAMVVEAVKSALAQTYRHVEIIVVDDGSTDDTPEVLRQFGDRIEVVRQANQGVSGARNTAMRQTTGEFVAFLDADDFWHPQKLELQHAALVNHPDISVLGTAVFKWPGPIPENPDQANSANINRVPLEDLVVKNRFTTSSVMVRQSALMQWGSSPFDTDFKGAEDYDLWIRIAATKAVGNLSLPLTGFRRHLMGLGNAPQSMEAGARQILRKLDRNDVWVKAGGQSVRRRAYAYFHYSCALMHRSAGNNLAALGHLIGSLARYPLPFGKREIRLRFGRVHLLLVTAGRLLRPYEERPAQ
jgi:glycosyltransferase involved in cell wall biosynthesis